VVFYATLRLLSLALDRLTSLTDRRVSWQLELVVLGGLTLASVGWRAYVDAHPGVPVLDLREHPRLVRGRHVEHETTAQDVYVLSGVVACGLAMPAAFEQRRGPPLTAAVTIGAAALSYYVVERPALRFKERRASRSVPVLEVAS